MVAVFGFLDAGISSSSSSVSALVRLDLALRLAGLVALDVALVLTLDAGLEEVVPSAVESKFAATAIA